jgi:hypothetical protein
VSDSTSPSEAPRSCIFSRVWGLNSIGLESSFIPSLSALYSKSLENSLVAALDKAPDGAIRHGRTWRGCVYARRGRCVDVFMGYRVVVGMSVGTFTSQIFDEVQHFSSQLLNTFLDFSWFFFECLASSRVSPKLETSRSGPRCFITAIS